MHRNLLAGVLVGVTACAPGSMSQREHRGPLTRVEIVDLGRDWCASRRLRCQVREVTLVPGGTWRVVMTVEGRRAEVVSLELDPATGAVLREEEPTWMVAAALVQTPEPEPAPMPPPPTGQKVLRAKDITAGRVVARIIYAKEVRAWDGRVNSVYQGRGEPSGQGQGELRAPDVVADVIYAKEIHTQWLEAQEVHAEKVRIGNRDRDDEGDRHPGKGHGRGHQKDR